MLKLFTDDSLKQKELRLRFESLLSTIPSTSHRRHNSIREMSDRQYELYLATLMNSDEYFTPGGLAENFGFPQGFVRQGLELLVAIGLVINVTLRYMLDGETILFIPVYCSMRSAIDDVSMDCIIRNEEIIT